MLDKESYSLLELLEIHNKQVHVVSELQQAIKAIRGHKNDWDIDIEKDTRGSVSVLWTLYKNEKKSLKEMEDSILVPWREALRMVRTASNEV